MKTIVAKNYNEDDNDDDDYDDNDDDDADVDDDDIKSVLFNNLFFIVTSLRYMIYATWT